MVDWALEQDATALGIRYELEFEVTLPSIDVDIWAGSMEKLELDRVVELLVTQVDPGCDLAAYDAERIDVKEITHTSTRRVWSMLKSSRAPPKSVTTSPAG